jgi:hypothetical protein
VRNISRFYNKIFLILQKRILRIMTDAPWYVKNDTLHTDLHLPLVTYIPPYLTPSSFTPTSSSQPTQTVYHYHNQREGLKENTIQIWEINSFVVGLFRLLFAVEPTLMFHTFLLLLHSAQLIVYVYTKSHQDPITHHKHPSLLHQSLFGSSWSHMPS